MSDPSADIFARSLASVGTLVALWSAWYSYVSHRERIKIRWRDSERNDPLYKFLKHHKPSRVTTLHVTAPNRPVEITEYWFEDTHHRKQNPWPAPEYPKRLEPRETISIPIWDLVAHNGRVDPIRFRYSLNGRSIRSTRFVNAATLGVNGNHTDSFIRALFVHLNARAVYTYQWFRQRRKC